MPAEALNTTQLEEQCCGYSKEDRIERFVGPRCEQGVYELDDGGCAKCIRDDLEGNPGGGYVVAELRAGSGRRLTDCGTTVHVWAQQESPRQPAQGVDTYEHLECGFNATSHLDEANRVTRFMVVAQLAVPTRGVFNQLKAPCHGLDVMPLASVD